MITEAVTKQENEISRLVVDAAIEVHSTLGGPGLLESIYEEAFMYELEIRGLSLDRQVVLPVVYKGRVLRRKLRVDLIADGCVLIECKAVAAWNPVFEAQMLTYLRITGLKLGMLVNFGERTVVKGIHRVVNGL